MTTVVTIRDVPDEVKEALARDARERGQSLQAFLLGVLLRQAAFRQNRQMLADIERDLAAGGGAGAGAPDAKDVIEAARARADRAGDTPGGLVSADDRR
jgi:antitoxin FitA